ncbi:hypothetical protein RHMOL_Rhmol13G0079100 [Rhododendron molle]|uniref:Uncharacterized protein n=1 Tax=Rhododendron molle TaxID=49168 RepID=A0ACC0L541_RHOML|nr:hypothetical protein RHMOL_Rhmol13G0079100 [Rhododendron molle]
MSSPPILPVSVTSLYKSSVASPALRAFASRSSDSLRRAFAGRRPWTELADHTAFSRPDTLAVAASRVRKNASYFRVNYLTVVAAVLAFSLLSHPFSLLTLVSLLAAWLLLYVFRQQENPVVVYGRTFSDAETLGVLIALTVIVFFLTSVGSLLLWAALVGSAIVCVHGAFRVPEDLFLDDQEQMGSGLFSYVGGAASSAAVATAPSVIISRA